MEGDNSMPELVAIELKAHIPARDFEVSKQFYQDIGFTLCWSTGGPSFITALTVSTACPHFYCKTTT